MHLPKGRRRLAWRTQAAIVPVAFLVVGATNAFHPAAARAEDRALLVFACNANNDLFHAASAAGTPPPRYDTPVEALRNTAQGGAMLILADGYPDKRTEVPSSLLAEAAVGNVRLLVEFPAALPDLEIGAPRAAQWERAVIASDFFGASLPRLRILAVHGCYFLPLKAATAHVVMARVAGYDTAVFGLPDETWPILAEHPTRKNVLIATTKLSQFVTGRYAPAEAWSTIWSRILVWLQSGSAAPEIKWQPSVRPSFGRDDTLPADVETQALRRGMKWYFGSRMLIHPNWQKAYDEDANAWTDRTGPAPRPDWPCGDGSLGVLEGFSSRIDVHGRQQARWWRRHDCNGETACALALAGVALKDEQTQRVGANIVDWLYGNSILTHGHRADPKHPAYGLIGWNDVPKYSGNLDGYAVYYGDDCARGLLGVLAVAAALQSDRWDERAARGLYANLRLAGSNGFQPDRINEPSLEKLGWKHFHEAPTVSYDMNYQAYPWACYLWSYRQSGYRPFLEAARKAIRMTMDAYPDKWRWTESMQVERARILLPLAWLVRVEDTAEHRGWLKRIADDLLKYQDACGAIREVLGPPGQGAHTPPRSNAEYGTAEASLIQSDGDPAVDFLYTANFALLGLHEAAAATREPFYREAEDKLVSFLCRAQALAPGHPELDGAWFRAFDFRRWEYWASSADTGWGAWCIETGWSQSWIVSVLAMRELKTSLWDLTRASKIGRYADSCRQEFELPG